MRLARRNLFAALVLSTLLLGSGGAAGALEELAPGSTAIVLGTGGSGAKVRSGPGLNYSTLGVVPERARLRVVSGPRSDGDLNWYQIRSTDGADERVRGWVAGRYLAAQDQVVVRSDGSLGSRTLTAKVSSYTSGGGIGNYTSTGTRVRWGTVAVDPQVIPLGSLLLIDGLDGIFSAEDTGGAVKGAVLDVWFPDLASALEWGVQFRAVTVLREGY